MAASRHHRNKRSSRTSAYDIMREMVADNADSNMTTLIATTFLAAAQVQILLCTWDSSDDSVRRFVQIPGCAGLLVDLYAVMCGLGGLCSRHVHCASDERPEAVDCWKAGPILARGNEAMLKALLVATATMSWSFMSLIIVVGS
ncbi:hypothetical protein BDW22DRAFT_1432982 [Trametopsis cervina]|nr:hypothetical protein BDW22DRAFT_1432982 [Trametopsis cervina]